MSGGHDYASAVGAALTDRQRTLIELSTPRIYRWMAGWRTPDILVALYNGGYYAHEVTEFLDALPPELGQDPHAPFAAIAMRRMTRLFTRPVLEDILRAIPRTETPDG